MPKGRFAYIFPNKSSALIQVRFRPDLSEGQRDRAIDLVRRAVAMPDWKLPNGKGTYVVTGAPVVVSDLTKSISHSLIVLLVAALVVMAITLSLVFRARLRLLPLVVAVAAAGLTFGALSLTGASLTMASIAVLPVLIGLAVDYAIQLQARVQEAQAAGDGIEAAVARTAQRGAPTVATAAAATAAGFVVLALSPVPMVRGFGLLLVAGIALALGCALTLGVAALSAAARRRAPRPPARGALAPAWRGAGELLVANRAALAVRRRGAAVGRGALRLATVHPGRVVLVALVVAVAGWGLETQTRVESDLTKLVPQNGAIHDLQALQRSTDVGGEIDVVVSGPRVTDPAVVKWMTGYQARCSSASATPTSAAAARPSCARRSRCPTSSGRPERDPPADRGPARRRAALLLAGRDHAPTGARRPWPSASGSCRWTASRSVIDGMRDRLHPPAGIDAELAGLPVLAAEANAAVSSPWRRLGTLLAGLAAVALVLFAAFRAWQRAFVPLLPIALATGWSALVLFALRIPLNPMSVVLGALVIAISTEFSVLLAERYRAERAGRPRARRGAAAHLPLDRRRGAGLGHHGDRRLRRAHRLGHQDAARLRLRHGRRPHRRAARGHGRAAGGAAAGRAGAAAPARCRGWAGAASTAQRAPTG